jgi:hypothetical protein
MFLLLAHHIYVLFITWNQNKANTSTCDRKQASIKRKENQLKKVTCLLLVCEPTNFVCIIMLPGFLFRSGYQLM